VDAGELGRAAELDEGDRAALEMRGEDLAILTTEVRKPRMLGVAGVVSMGVLGRGDQAAEAEKEDEDGKGAHLGF
jgi:hypothetical protein